MWVVVFANTFLNWQLFDFVRSKCVVKRNQRCFKWILTLVVFCLQTRRFNNYLIFILTVICKYGLHTLCDTTIVYIFIKDFQNLYIMWNWMNPSLLFYKHIILGNYQNIMKFNYLAVIKTTFRVASEKTSAPARYLTFFNLFVNIEITENNIMRIKKTQENFRLKRTEIPKNSPFSFYEILQILNKYFFIRETAMLVFGKIMWTRIYQKKYYVSMKRKTFLNAVFILSVTKYKFPQGRNSHCKLHSEAECNESHFWSFNGNVRNLGTLATCL